MADRDTYFQCLLRCGESETVGWIEARNAKRGAIVELLPSKELWQVVEVYGRSLSTTDLAAVQRLNRKSLPSVEGIG